MAIRLDKEYHSPSLTIKEHEHRLIELSLHRNNGNRKASAQELGITERTLYRRLNEFNMKGFPSTWSKSL